MVKEDVLKYFLMEAPACLMVRATLKRMFAAEVLDELFQEHAEVQYERELLLDGRRFDDALGLSSHSFSAYSLSAAK
ncbi:hypothetical protein [Thalassoglobus polymorphus]|uniref:Uncharacterized protein n=1 Tax=Thalassoglobus polymorphus TaxID=2527994 RepID=A0A517QKZ0_9PLAN|nr:hypothetical protein [Thalassoglobus polymorphus]QDT32310.1 hypothetical protein Mal48_15530 [Thalassoglobus polymorphus]